MFSRGQGIIEMDIYSLSIELCRSMKKTEKLLYKLDKSKKIKLTKLKRKAISGGYDIFVIELRE